jgi:DNA helicase II / ATP-dependent DNA helicase PcrA
MFATASELRLTPELPPWLEELNDEQRTAATHPGGPLLVIASAGTGKTTTLCARVAWLLHQGVPADRILLLTFTRRAARELLERAASLVARSVPDAGRVVGGTFHSVAHREVRAHASALGLPGDFGVLDAADAADVLDLVREEHGHAEARRRFPRKGTLLDIYSRVVNAQRPLGEVLAEDYPWCEEHGDALAGLFRAYAARKRTLGLLDLDDLLLYWRALARDEVVGRGLEDAYDHVLVDEYQDVNGLQVDIIRALRTRRRELTVVGDDLQAIYGFRAASADHILSFGEHFPDASIVTLEASYRAGQPLLDAAAALASEARRRYPRALRSAREDGQRPRLIFCRDEQAQAAHVAQSVLDAREQGMLLREQAVLGRTGHDSELLELELRRRRIPFVKYGGLRYLDAAHVKDLVALLRLADNHRDELAWFRVLQLLDGVGPATARRVTQALTALPSRGDLAAGNEGVGALLPASARVLAEELIRAVAESDVTAATATRAELLATALTPLVTAHYPNGPLRVQDFDPLLGAARDQASLSRFVAEIALDPPASTQDLAGPPHLDEDYLVLSTIHSAKGLEWEAVHVLALYDGNFPACMSAGSGEEIEEERRLLYVAMTRARQSLSLYVPVRYYHRPRGRDDGHGIGKPSRFLTDRVREACDVLHLHASGVDPGVLTAPRRIEVSVDALFS